MRYKTIGLGLGKNIRIKQWDIIKPIAYLEAEVEEGEDTGKVIDEIKKDLRILLDEIVADELEARRGGKWEHFPPKEDE